MADTPDLLADALVRAVGVDGANSWLDPSAGSGQLVQAVLRAGISPESITALDLQTHLPALQSLGVECALGIDFLDWAQGTDRRFDRVIANPPFVRLVELEESLARTALEIPLNGVSVPATANYWVPFLVAGIQLLSPGGSLAYVLPASWEYANYATGIRSLCESSFRELDVHRVSVPMFEDVADGSIMLVGRGYGQEPRRQSRVTRHSTLSALAEALGDSEASDGPVGTRSLESSLPEGHVRFGEIAQVRVGAVTGHASYFLLTQAQRLDLGLPRSAVRPVLSKARHILSSEIDKDAWTSMLNANERVWLFDPSGTDLLHPAVRAYLDLAESDGGCRREAMKIRDRDPWYRVPVPSAFDGFATGMSHTRPWVALNRMAGLTASNTLYGVRFTKAKSWEERAAWCLSMLSSTTAESRAQLVRQYPQGLLKLEPGDMASLVVRRPSEVSGACDLYRLAVESIVDGQPETAQTLADAWLEG